MKSNNAILLRTSKMEMDGQAKNLYNQAMRDKTLFRAFEWDAPAGCGIRLVSSAEATNIIHARRGEFRQPFWVIDYAFDRESLCKIGSARNAWETRPANVAHIYMPGTPYWEDTCDEGFSAHSAYICFNMENEEILRPILNNSRRYARIYDPEKVLVGRILRIVDIGMDEGDDAYFDAQAALCEIINLLRHARRLDEFSVEVRRRYRVSKLSDLAMSVRAYLRNNIARNVKLEEIARHAGVSVSTLTHSYKLELGQTPIETHQDLRMNQIRRLLIKGEPPKAIAHTLGFKDVYHLSKYFKRLEGLSPRAYLASVNVSDHSK